MNMRLLLTCFILTGVVHGRRLLSEPNHVQRVVDVGTAIQFHRHMANAYNLLAPATKDRRAKEARSKGQNNWPLQKLPRALRVGGSGTPPRKKAPVKKPPPPSGDLVACEAQLDEAKAQLASCKSSLSYMYVQMGSMCTLSRDDEGATLLKIADMNEETWNFTDRPMRYSGVSETSTFFEDFEAKFSEENGGKPNAGITMVHENDSVFEGPLVAVLIESAYVTSSGVYVYKITQSDEQAGILPVDAVLPTPTDGSMSVEIIFQDCTIFIEDL